MTTDAPAYTARERLAALAYAQVNPQEVVRVASAVEDDIHGAGDGDDAVDERQQRALSDMLRVLCARGGKPYASRVCRAAFKAVERGDWMRASDALADVMAEASDVDAHDIDGDAEGWRTKVYLYRALDVSREVVIAHREGDAGRRLLCDLDAVEARVQMNALAGSTGAFAWSAGFVMSEFAMSCPECVRDRRVIELGSGAGVCGVVLARLRPRALVLTDRDESTLENLARNVRANADGVNDANVPSRAYDVTFDAIEAPVVDDVSRVSIRALDWGRMSARDARALSPDVVLAADCAYDPDLIPSLVHAIRTLLDHSGRDASTDCGSFTTSSWSVDDARAFFLDDAPQRRSSPCAIVVSAVRQPKTMDVLINALVHDGALNVRDITSAFARLPIRFAHGDAERAHALDDCRAFLCTTTIAHDGNDDEYTQHKPSNSGSS